MHDIAKSAFPTGNLFVGNALFISEKVTLYTACFDEIQESHQMNLPADA